MVVCLWFLLLLFFVVVVVVVFGGGGGGGEWTRGREHHFKRITFTDVGKRLYLTLGASRGFDNSINWISRSLRLYFVCSELCYV